jgi:tetratricopeptide (TPR) repeat protein
MATGGHYKLGFELTPLTEEGNLDTSGDFNRGPHPIAQDPLFKMAEESRDQGNKNVGKGDFEAAIGCYSDLIMKLRAVENETDIEWNDASYESVHQLRAAAYLNLSLCFLKTQQWTHASNTATRALQGDKEPADPKHDVLTPEKKAKALFRRAQAQNQGFGNFDKAVEDLKKALEYSPEDKAVQQELKRIQQEMTKATKAADKKLAGFLSGSKAAQKGEGIFKESERPSDEPSGYPKQPTEPVKVTDGLWIAPKNELEKAVEEEEQVDPEELAREIMEIREEQPEKFKELREQVKDFLLSQEAVELKAEEQEREEPQTEVAGA